MISLLGVSGLMDAARSILGIEPVASGVVEDYVQNDANAPFMSLSHQPRHGHDKRKQKTGIEHQVGRPEKIIATGDNARDNVLAGVPVAAHGKEEDAQGDQQAVYSQAHRSRFTERLPYGWP